MRRLPTKRLALGLALLVVGVASATPTHAQPAPPRAEQTCILFEDGSFMCGYAAPPPTEYLDRTRPFVMGCIPDSICDSPDGFRGEGLDGLYSEVAFPPGDPRDPTPYE